MFPQFCFAMQLLLLLPSSSSFFYYPSDSLLDSAPKIIYNSHFNRSSPGSQTIPVSSARVCEERQNYS